MTRSWHCLRRKPEFVSGLPLSFMVPRLHEPKLCLLYVCWHRCDHDRGVGSSVTNSSPCSNFSKSHVELGRIAGENLGVPRHDSHLYEAEVSTHWIALHHIAYTMGCRLMRFVEFHRVHVSGVALLPARSYHAWFALA